MRFSREMTGLTVLHKSSGRELGKVREWLLDEHGESVIALVADGGGWLPQQRVFAFNDIVHIGQDAIMVAKEGVHTVADLPSSRGQAACRALGKRMLSENGEELGVVEDILFEEKTGRVTGWRLSSGLIDDLLQGRPVLHAPSQLAIGEDALIIRD